MLAGSSLVCGAHGGLPPSSPQQLPLVPRDIVGEETTAQVKLQPHGAHTALSPKTQSHPGKVMLPACPSLSRTYNRCLMLGAEIATALLNAAPLLVVPVLTKSPVTRAHKGGLFCLLSCPQPCVAQPAALPWLFPPQPVVRSGQRPGGH